jgi:hypothetical protein
MPTLQQLFTVCVTATASNAQRAKDLCLDWVKSANPFATETVDEMLPLALSPNGAAPATDYLCCMTLTHVAIDHMQEHRSRNNSPVTITVVGPQEDTLEAQFANRDRYLASIGRKVIS